jgi:hypothetical protein
MGLYLLKANYFIGSPTGEIAVSIDARDYGRAVHIGDCKNLEEAVEDLDTNYVLSKMGE